MEKPYYRAIILVLASDNEPIYKAFKKIQETYMNENPLVKFFFVYGAGTTFERQEYDLVYDDIKETHWAPWMTMKVIRAFEYIDSNFAYDYLIRTNLSTFWDLSLLLERLDTLPKNNCLSGRLGLFPPPFVTGTSMIISDDLIPLIIKDQQLVNISYEKYVAEDRMISEVFTNHCNVPIIQSDQHIVIFENVQKFNYDEILKIIQQRIINRHDHFRLKNMYDRQIDIEIAKLLCQVIYNKSL